MAQKEVIYAGELIPAKSLIGLLDGTEMFCVENPWFSVPGMRPIDKKTYMELKPSKANFGVMLSPVYLLVRTMDRKPFNSKFVIGYTNARGERKNYFVMKEYDISKIRENVRHKLIVSPGTEKQLADENLIKLDQQLCMVMDVLLIAKIMDMDMKAYAGMHDNKQFFHKFVDDVNDKMRKTTSSSDQLTVADDTYINMFDNPPYYYMDPRSKELKPMFELGGRPKSSVVRLMTSFSDACATSGYEEFIDQQKRSLLVQNAFAIPSIRMLDFVKNQEHKVRYDSRLTFCIKLGEKDKGYNPNFKDFLVTQKALGGGKYQPVTPEILSTFWGGSLSDPTDKSSSGATQSGCLFLVPQLSFKFYKQGNPTVDWRVEKIAVKRINSQLGVNYTDGDEFAGDDEEDAGDGSGGDNQFDNGEGPTVPDDSV